MPTLKSLIESGKPVRWNCTTCSAGGRADLAAMALAKGEDFELMDCTPWCKVPECLGRVWFAVPLGSWHEKLLTKAGDDRLFAHGDWVFAERMRLRKAKV